MEVVKPSSAYPYLRSCKEESDKAIEGQVTGTIPSWLNGNLVRLGPGLLEVGPDRYNHFFDGLALMHRFGFADGRVTYQSKFLKSDTYKRNMKANRIVVSEFATPGCPDPCKTIFQRFTSLFSLDEMTDNDLVNVIMFGDEVYASSETNCIWKIDPETLESLEKVKLSTILPVNAAIAHAHEDADGTVYNIGSTYSMNCSYKILQFPSKAANKTSNALESGRVLFTIPSSKLMNVSYHHSFAMTEDYFVFVEQPLYLSIPRMTFAHFSARAYADAMSWDKDTPTRFHVIKRSNNQLLDTKYVAKSFFVFHHINAYEEDNHLVVDLCGYDNGDILNSLYFKALEDKFYNRNNVSEPILSSSRRYVLPLATGQSKEADKNLINLPTKATAYYQADGSIYCNAEILTGSEQWSLELPRINYQKFNGKNYRYFYAMGQQGTLERYYLVKVDVVNKTCINWSEEGAIPSEPVYIADPNAENPEEDTGIILASLLYRSDETKLSLLVLDARSMKEISRTTFITKSSVPATFHGTFVPKKKVQSS